MAGLSSLPGLTINLGGGHRSSQTLCFLTSETETIMLTPKVQLLARPSAPHRIPQKGRQNEEFSLSSYGKGPD